MISMRKFNMLLKSKIACFSLAVIMLVLFWGGAIMNIYGESGGDISGIKDLWTYCREQGAMFIIGLIAGMSFLVSGFQASKYEKEQKRIQSRRESAEAAEVANKLTELSAEEDRGVIHTLRSGGKVIDIVLPSKYRLVDVEADDSAYAGFNEKYKPEIVFCSLQEAIDDETPENYVRDELADEESFHKTRLDGSDTGAHVKNKQVAGVLYYYYYLLSYKKKRKKHQKFAAACDVGDGLFYTVETEWVGRDEEMKFESMYDFLNINIH